jgi:hypothetical protein
MDQIWTFNLAYIYVIRYVSFFSTYNVLSFYALSYLDAAQLRATSSSVSISSRVDDIITIMNLHHCKHRWV